VNNIVGKILIVLNLVFCILFMCFAGAVYTFAGAWKDKALDLEGRLEVAQKATEDANSARDRETKQLNALLSAATSERDLVKAQLQDAQTADASSRAQLAQAEQERDKALADAEVASTEASARVAEAEVLNKEVQSLRDRINQLIQRARTTEDSLLDLQGRLASAEKRETDLLADNGKLRDQLRSNDIEPGEFGDSSTEEGVARVDGFVEGLIRNQARTQELVQITIGSDDKIRKDMSMIVYRGGNYICEARVIKVYPDKAICVVDEKTRTDTIERGDNVTTKLGS